MQRLVTIHCLELIGGLEWVVTESWVKFRLHVLLVGRYLLLSMATDQTLRLMSLLLSLWISLVHALPTAIIGCLFVSFIILDSQLVVSPSA